MFLYIERLERVKQIARWLRKHGGVSLSKGYELASQMHGYEGWNHLRLRWSELNHSASKEPGVLNRQFRKVLQDSGIEETDAIMALILPESEEEERPTIKITADDMRRGYADVDPRAATAVETLERLYRAGQHSAVVAEASAVLRSVGPLQRPRFFELLTLSQKNSPETALFASALYATGLISDPDKKVAIELLQHALTSRIHDIVLHAHYGLGIALRDTDPRGAADNMQIAFAGGLLAAVFAVAKFHESGTVQGFPKNVAKAMDYYFDLHENHGYPSAKRAIAEAIIVHDLDYAGYAPEELLAELVEDGDTTAEPLLRRLRVLRHRKDMDSRLPFRVTPDGGSRPKLVRDALEAQFGITRPLAEGVTAALYGYHTWLELMKASNDENGVKDKADEDCDETERESRRRLQADVLGDYLDLREPYALCCIELLQPTGRSVKPSLKSLETTIRQRALAARLGKDYEMIRAFAGRIDPDPDGLLAFVYGSVR